MAEIIVGLVTISCIVATFAPVVTKKLNSADISLSNLSSNRITNDCDDRYGEGVCKACNANRCFVCSTTCDSDQYLYRNDCTCIDCDSSADNKGYGDGCNSCNNDKGFVL